MVEGGRAGGREAVALVAMICSQVLFLRRVRRHIGGVLNHMLIVPPVPPPHRPLDCKLCAWGAIEAPLLGSQPEADAGPGLRSLRLVCSSRPDMLRTTGLPATGLSYLQ